MRMTILGSLFHTRRCARRTRRVPALLLAPLLLLMGACSDIARLVTPGKSGASGPAMVAVTATVPRALSVANEVVTLNVTASYLRQDGTRVRIGSQVLALTTETLQSVPIPVDVGTCLADGARDLSGGNNNASCAVVLNLALLVNGTIVDEQVVGPLRLAPGAVTTVAQPVTLIALASVQLLQAGGAIVLPSETVQALLGGTTQLSARVLDTRGQAVVDRAVAWTSDAPAVATIDASTGVITTVSIGTTRVTARIGALTTTATVRVVRPPAALTINGGSGGGTGSIRSTPTGIDCRVVGASISGTCSFSFSSDAAVTLTSSAEAGSVFTAWGDACAPSSIGPTCQVQMSQARIASARFSALRRVVVTTSTGGDGRGRVTGASGLDCRIAAGAISGTCLVDVPEGAPFQLSATGEPLPGGGTLQFFAGWGGDCAGATGSTCIVTPGSSNLAATARFVDAQAISVSIGGVGGGMVTGGSTIACVRANGANTGACGESATFGTSITLTAIPDANSSFGGWSGACSGQSTTCTTTLTQSRSAVATFTRRQVTLTLVLNGPGLGDVLVNGAPACALTGTQTANSCTQTFEVGQAVSINATAAASSLFGGFGGACTGTGSCSLTLTQSQTVTVSFTVSKFPLTVTLSGTGAGTVVATDGVVCTSTLGQTSVTCTRLVDFGSTVSLNATPTVESVFGGFSGDCSGSGACSVTMNAPKTVNATYTRRQVQFTTLLTGTGAGTVTAGGSVLCTLALAQRQSTCSRMIDYGATVTLVGNPTVESTFEVFGGDCSGGGTSCSLTPTTASTITASFKRRQVPLTIALSGTGAGTVSIDGSVACALPLGQKAVTCSRIVDAGATLSVTGAAAASSIFDGFTGDCTGKSNCTLVASNARTVNASYTRRQVQLTVNLTGLGGGSITADGASICSLVPAQGSSTCTRPVDYGDTLVFLANPTIESVFGGFGGSCSTATSCTLMPTAAATIDGSFDIKMLPLALTLEGSGGGSVTVNGSTACSLTAGQSSAMCVRAIAYGTKASIVSTPSFDSSIDGLRGDCVGASSCSVDMTDSRAVTAAFTQRQVPLVLTLTGTGGGVVTVGGLAACTLAVGQGSVTCTRLVEIGSTTLLLGIPISGSSFAGFTGDCASAASGHPGCSVTMSTARAASARFSTTGAIRSSR